MNCYCTWLFSEEGFKKQSACQILYAESGFWRIALLETGHNTDLPLSGSNTSLPNARKVLIMSTTDMRNPTWIPSVSHRFRTCWIGLLTRSAQISLSLLHSDTKSGITRFSTKALHKSAKVK